MSIKSEPLDKTDNTHRSLRRLVVVDAVFRRSSDDASRYTLHADVIFNEERLGGGDDTGVIFSIAVRRCEVVFIRPKFDFNVDRNSVRRQKPMGPQEVARSRQKKKTIGGRVKLALAASSSANAEVGYEGNRTTEETVKSAQMKSMFNEQLTRSVNGHDAWRVDGRELEGGRLTGPVFDFEAEPRLTLVDLRSEVRRLSDETNEMIPLSRIEVRCLRDDIDVYDVRLKDEEKHSFLSSKPGHKERIQIARGVIREALLQEGLSVGSLLDDPFAEMTICDVTIPIIDQSTESRRTGPDSKD